MRARYSAWVRGLNRLARDGTAEPVSRDQSFRPKRRHTEKHVFLVQLTTSRVGNTTRLVLNLLKVMTDRTRYYYINLNKCEFALVLRERMDPSKIV